MARYLYLSGYGRDIGNSTRAIETARDTARRAAAYAQRGGAHSEKARYCRAFKLIPADEYDRLFSLAIKEHDQAVALDPASAQAHFSRGRTYYDRAALEVDKDATRWFGPAAADFQKAVERDGRQYMAWDMLGLVMSRPAKWTRPSAITRRRWRSIRWARRVWPTPIANADPLITKRRSTMPPTAPRAIRMIR
jgi:tetratricopeptide (TPR) repeat protein